MFILIIGEHVLIAHLCSALIIKEDLELNGMSVHGLLQEDLSRYYSFEDWLTARGLTK